MSWAFELVGTTLLDLGQTFRYSCTRWLRSTAYGGLLCFGALSAVDALPGEVYLPYQAARVSDGGSISGRMLLVSGKAESERYMVSKDVGACTDQERLVEWIRTTADGGLLDSVAYIEDINVGKPFLEQLDTIVVKQEGCQYRPWLQVVRDGGTMEVKNLDSVMHNIHAYEVMQSARRSFVNAVQQPGEQPVSATVHATRGNVVKIECDAHDFMHAWLFIARNPYYAVVDSRGEFRISDIPPGNYRVKAWHGRLGYRGEVVEVRAHEDTHLDFSY